MLEEHLGARLFMRTTRSIGLTDVGKRFLADGRRILLELEEAENAAVGSHSEPRGALSITAPVLFGRMFVTPALHRSYAKTGVPVCLTTEPASEIQYI